jgi:hypothetical protein
MLIVTFRTFANVPKNPMCHRMFRKENTYNDITFTKTDGRTTLQSVAISNMITWHTIFLKNTLREIGETNIQLISIYRIFLNYKCLGDFGGLVVRSRPKPSDFWGEKILSIPSFEREVNPFASWHRFAACKTFLNGVKGVISSQLRDHPRPQFHLSLLGALAILRTWRHVAEKVGMSKGRGKQWQTTPKNLPRMQRARAILVAWLDSGSC